MPRTAEDRKRANAAAAARSRAKKDARITELEAKLAASESKNKELMGMLRIKGWIDEVRSELAEGKKGIFDKVLNR